MTEVSFDHYGFLFSLSFNPDILVEVSIKANQKLTFNSELNTLTSCQSSNEVRTVVFFATNSNEDPIAVSWGRYNPQQLSSLVDLDVSNVGFRTTN